MSESLQGKISFDSSGFNERKINGIGEQRVAQVHSVVSEYLSSKGWHSASCECCHTLFLTKGQKAICGDEKCNGYEFIGEKRKNPPSIFDIADKFHEVVDPDFQYCQPLPIVRDNSTTVFTGTAGQLFDPFIHEEIEAPLQGLPIYTIQPVIRLQGRKIVGKKEGFSTSFTLLATEQFNATLENHMSHFEHWIEILSEVGLFAGDLTLRHIENRPNWGNGEFNTDVIKVFYKGLELGVSNFFINIPLIKSQTSATMSDITFGLERLTWAARKNRLYFGVFNPLIEVSNDQIEQLDAYRTLVLLSASGVESGHRDVGSKYKNLADTAFSFSQPFKDELVNYYYEWWSHFQSFPLDLITTTQVISIERNKRLNLALKKQFNLPDALNIKQPIETTLIYAQMHGILDDDLIQFMKNQHGKTN
ncbi:hypothetical protein A2313_02960 [Candidatus Roizmanbacteria bacterium RIFOXYB2_FULL_41_10]|nr:MAG: hypothetical protein A2377_03810 [Candidatus Roizmanbacteria bacterium RIFOXYB1_FULL_41_27]OGK71989.1 MAG: hypothetical protein A2403_03475 [Candidatus Roizmanbacteria bacterium RIFOXYC1_FULL_41_16]OGK72092.1 MAG: hypothetical protein A2313_02960 [Candidatus Roizmanbacteria bacterium RIFOXYB2_FULL_41_10]OGK75396.1 MAG: hypothetical protein A2575_02170 [Candidatus Roizmanbacteria bacterium RIFOXYD1_FULL_41_24]